MNRKYLSEATRQTDRRAFRSNKYFIDTVDLLDVPEKPNLMVKLILNIFVQQTRHG